MSQATSRTAELTRRGLASLVVLTAATGPFAIAERARAGTTRPTIVSLTFDDGWRDQYTEGWPLLRAHRMRGTFYLISGSLGESQYLTRSDVAALAGGGNEIGGHTVDHEHLPILSREDQKREICTDRATLAGLGYRVTSFAYPYGEADSISQQVVAECGYSSARTVGGLGTSDDCDGCVPAESIPPENAYYTRSRESIKADTPLETIKEYITRAEQSGGGWVQLVLHHVCADCGDSYSISPQTLSALLDWLEPRAAAGTVVRTVDEVIGGAAKPVSSGPPLPESGVGNLVRNASLESVGDRDVPTCFQLGGYGENSYAWRRTTAAHTGRYAEQLTIYSITSGDRKLVTKQDSSGCVPAATPGRRYRAGVWYRGTWDGSATVKLTIYLRDAAGTWMYWTSGGPLAASAGWASTPEYTTPPVPAGATGLSLGIALAGVGVLITDDYTVSDSAST